MHRAANGGVAAPDGATAMPPGALTAESLECDRFLLGLLASHWPLSDTFSWNVSQDSALYDIVCLGQTTVLLQNV